MGADKIIPLIVYRDIAAGQAFLVEAFGFRPGRLERDAAGRVIHGEVHHGDDVIWLHAVAPASEMAAPSGPASSGMVVYVANVDAHFRKARDAGAAIDSEPRDQFYGQREYGARDPEGHRWWFATPKA